MKRSATRPVMLGVTLVVLSAIPILVSALRLGQIAEGTLPPESLRFAEVPLRHGLHAAAGIAFALLGPLQLARAAAGRYGPLHRLAGRGFALAGLALGLSGLGLLIHFPTAASPALDIARALAGLALIVTLGLGIRAARARRIDAHRAWMLRAYAIGMGSGTVALVMAPLAALGIAPTGAGSDLVFIGAWVGNLALADLILAIRRATEASRAARGPRPA